MTDSVNQRVRLLAGRYEIGALIGRGGMADVRLGTDARLGRKVAIKLACDATASYMVLSDAKTAPSAMMPPTKNPMPVRTRMMTSERAA